MDDATLSTFGEYLKAFRKRSKLTQQALATRIGVHRNTIGTWENGDFLPASKTVVLELAHQLQLTPHDTQRLLETSLTALSPYWSVPYPRNPFFTGRADVLHQLYEALRDEHAAGLSQSYALSGLGGIGKTQTALEYAYRYAHHYSAVFWIEAETSERLASSMLAIVELLQLPEQQEPDQGRVVAAVTRWLTRHRHWLLIVDNIEDPALVKGVLPAAREGSLLFISRRQALGLAAQTLALEPLTPEEGLRLLLQRASPGDPRASRDRLSPTEEVIARAIVAALDGLPLALDQAGAYIEATGCSWRGYLHLFQSSPLRLLAEREAFADHPGSVTTTFALAFEQLERRHPWAAEVLTVCAFLAPAAVPEAFFLEGAPALGPTFEALAADPFQFNAAFQALLSYSLLHRNATTKTVTIHRLVQAVLKGRLSEAVQRTWAARVIRALSQLFPEETQHVDYWQVCERLLPHALLLVTLGEQWGEHSAELITLMSHVATYLRSRARYDEADSLFQQALHLGEHTLGADHPLRAEVLCGFARLRTRQGKYKEAEAHFQQALHSGTEALGADHPLRAEILYGLAILYSEQGKYAEAEPCYQQALHIWQQAWGPEHDQVIKVLSTLAIFYAQQGKPAEAESLFRYTLRIREQVLGADHPLVAASLNDFAYFCFEQGQYAEAEQFSQRALRIWEQTLGPDHPNVSYGLHTLAELSRAQGKYEAAQALYERALRILEQAFGAEHPEIATVLQGLAELSRVQEHDEQAEAFSQQALRIRGKASTR